MTNPNRTFETYCTKFVPETESRYKIVISSTCIQLADSKTNKKIEPDDNNLYDLIIYGRSFRKSLAWLIGFTYKPLYKAESFAEDWDIGFKDPEETLLHPNNLFWITEKNGTKCPENEEYFVVPGYSRHAISKTGKPFSRVKLRLQDIRAANNNLPNSYLNTSFVNDAGSVCTVGVHRMLCLALEQVVTNPDRLTANHRDGNKQNNIYSNLEINTYRENNIHAKDEKLNNTREPVFVRDYTKKIDFWYKSISDAALALVTNSGVISEYIERGGHGKLFDRYKIRKVSYIEIHGWEDKQDFKIVHISNVELPCAAKNIHTDEIFIANSIEELAKMIKKSVKDVILGVTKTYRVPLDGFLYVTDKELNLLNVVYDEIELKYFEANPRSKIPLKLTWRKIGEKFSETMVFDSVSNAFHQLSNILTMFYAFKERLENKKEGSFELEGYAFEFKKIWL